LYKKAFQLTPKIPRGFWQYQAVLDIVGEIVFTKTIKCKKLREATIELTSKVTIFHSMGLRRL
jgi:hypothetical protein